MELFARKCEIHHETLGFDGCCYSCKKKEWRETERDLRNLFPTDFVMTPISRGLILNFYGWREDSIEVFEIDTYRTIFYRPAQLKLYKGNKNKFLKDYQAALRQLKLASLAKPNIKVNCFPPVDWDNYIGLGSY